jgi:hypothetical protein
MYIYFLPISQSQATLVGPLPSTTESVIPTPTHDGGVEHTEARFLPASTWLSMSRSGEVILFPPQFFLLHLISQFLTPVSPTTFSPDILEQQRTQLRSFLEGGDPPWADVCISPTALAIGPLPDKRTALNLETPGDEVKHLGRRGVKDYVVLLGRQGPTPANLDVRLRKDVLEAARQANL